MANPTPSPEIAIQLQQVSKQYISYSRPIDRLWSAFYPGHKAGKEFWALRNIDLTVSKGQALGIIGQNGAGKSTLLRIIAGTLTPTAGTVAVQGRVAALLELGSGFNPEFSGRENVHLNARLLGFRPAEIEQAMDSIIEFSEIGDFIDQPTKTYSSGMQVRLAFSVYSAIKPDIFIVDEALSVGDVFFKQKCFRRMEALLEGGTTVLMVSHSFSAISAFCGTTCVLDRGVLVFMGPTDKAINTFHQLRRAGQLPSDPAAAATSPAPQPPARALDAATTPASSPDIPSLEALVEEQKRVAAWFNPKFAPDAAVSQIMALNVVNSLDQPSFNCSPEETLTFRLFFMVATADAVGAFVTVKNRYGKVIFKGGSINRGEPLVQALAHRLYVATLDVQMNLAGGPYTFRAGIESVEPGSVRSQTITATPWLGPITIHWNYTKDIPPFVGPFGLPYTHRFTEVEF